MAEESGFARNVRAIDKRASMLGPGQQPSQKKRASSTWDAGPMFPAQDRDFLGMRIAIAEVGCFVITDLFDPVAIAAIRERAEFVGRAWDYMIEHKYTTDIKEYVNGVFRAGHLPETHIDPARTWADLTTDTQFDEIATNIFGETTRGYALRRSILNGKQSLVRFHQDACFTGKELQYNFWTPLQDVGTDAASLEVVIGSGAPLIKNPWSDATKRYIEKTYGQKSCWTPKLKAGDVLVFTSMMFHRTQSSPEIINTRYSLELRGSIKDHTLAIVGVPQDWAQIEALENPIE